MLAVIFYIFPYLRRLHKTIAGGTDTFSCLSVCSHGTTRLTHDGFSLNLIWTFLLDLVDKFSVWLKSEKSNSHLQEDLYRFLHVLCEILAEDKEIVDCTRTLSSG